MEGTWLSKLYYNHCGNHFDKIAVGLVIVDEDTAYIKLSKKKLEIVKILNPKGYNLFKYSVKAFKKYYLHNGIDYDQMQRIHKNLNNMMGLSEPRKLHLKLTKDVAYRYFEKFINE